MPTYLIYQHTRLSEIHLLLELNDNDKSSEVKRDRAKNRNAHDATETAISIVSPLHHLSLKWIWLPLTFFAHPTFYLLLCLWISRIT